MYNLYFGIFGLAYNLWLKFGTCLMTPAKLLAECHNGNIVFGPSALTYKTASYLMHVGTIPCEI